jgi:hypothetical protein
LAGINILNTLHPGVLDMPLQIRRGLEAERLALTPATGLAQGELVYVTDSQRLYIGTGVSGEHKGVAITGYTNEDAQDAAAGLFTATTTSGTTNTNISFAYNDSANKVVATVDLSTLGTNIGLNGHTITGNGSITISGLVTADLKGSVAGDDSVLLVNGADSTVNLNETVVADIKPRINFAPNIGATSRRFNALFVSGTGGVDVGGALITTSGGLLNLPAGSLINGHPISPLDGAFTKLDIKGSVFGDDSSLLVDGVAGSIVGPVNSNTVRASTSVTSPLINVGSTSAPGSFNVYNSSDVFGTFFTITSGGPGAFLDFHASRGTLAAPTASQNNDYISGVLLKGHNGTTYVRSAAFVALADGNVVNGEVPGKVIISTKNYAGTLDNSFTFNSRGVFEAPVIKHTPFADATARDVGMSAGAGMIVYNTALAQFQGYTSAWFSVLTSDKIGYTAGVGGAVTQINTKSTSVTLNKISGQITTHTESLGGNTTVIFDVLNTTVSQTDTIIINMKSSGTHLGDYQCWIASIGNNTFTVALRNMSGSVYAEAVTMNFAVIKAVAA